MKEAVDKVYFKVRRLAAEAEEGILVAESEERKSGNEAKKQKACGSRAETANHAEAK